MKRKCLAVGIILLFIGAGIIPSALSEQTHGKNIIKVDDDGDGDYTSIKDAVNNSNPGDIIEVYSGTYVEGDILIKTSDITLKGLPYELDGGNATGKPLIVRKGFMQIMNLVADKITISGFIMEDKSQGNVRYQGDFIDVHSANGCLISNNTIQNGTNYSTGIYCINTTNVQIIDNIISQMDWNGISFYESKNASASGNIIINSEIGIFIESSEAINITKNKINGCGEGIGLSKSHNITLYLNNLESNSFGLSLEISTKNIIKHNNFINNSRNAGWLAVKVPIIQRWKSIFNSWIDNYWDDWIKIGPKIIPGLIFIFIGVIPGGEIQLPIVIPLLLFQLDRHPVREPYDIP
jgi:parallel beta-helix repeat protein